MSQHDPLDRTRGCHHDVLASDASDLGLDASAQPSTRPGSANMSEPTDRDTRLRGDR